MRYLLLSLLFLTGCNIKVDRSTPALVNVTCYDKDGQVTVAMKDYQGALTVVDDPDKSYKSDKCIIQRVK